MNLGLTLLLCLLILAAGAWIAFRTWAPSDSTWQLRKLFLRMRFENLLRIWSHLGIDNGYLLARYANRVRTQLACQMFRRSFEVQYANVDVGLRELAMGSAEYAILQDECAKAQAAMVKFFTKITDRQLAIVATQLSEEAVADAPPDPTIQFFVAEREIIRQIPHTAVLHWDRVREHMQRRVEEIIGTQEDIEAQILDALKRAMSEDEDGGGPAKGE